MKLSLILNGSYKVMFCILTLKYFFAQYCANCMWICWLLYFKVPVFSWPKTKLQNIGSGPKPPDISVDGNTVESVNSFVYLGSLQSSDGQCRRPDLTRRIGLACAVMTSLKRIWSDKRLTLDTKLRIYETLVCVTIRCRHLHQTPADIRTLEAFH